jgi:hypothetical protein
MLFFSITFAGFILFLPTIPPYLSLWGPKISFLRFSFQALVINEFKANSDLPLGENYIEIMGFDDFDEWTCFYILIGFTTAFAILTLSAHTYITFRN